jgi:carboxypeptidase C (cathepsin A)
MYIAYIYMRIYLYIHIYMHTYIYTYTWVVSYSGQFNIICNHLGTEKMLSKLAWLGKNEWLKSQPGIWLVDKQPAGYIKTYKNLQSLLGNTYTVINIFFFLLISILDLNFYHIFKF